MTPIIFLDFDGVLNGYSDPVPGGGLRGLDRVRVARLNRICDATGAHVVVTSAWRIGRTRCQLADILVAVGFTGMVAGLTPRGATRAEEIGMWWTTCPRKYRKSPFIIIDDEHEFWGMEQYLVRTDMHVGLTDADADKAIQLLGGI